jgi:hypothetical protein
MRGPFWPSGDGWWRRCAELVTAGVFCGTVSGTVPDSVPVVVPDTFRPAATAGSPEGRV